jgi:phosphoribosylanthranilate isomerase
MVAVKICGLKDQNGVDAVISAQANYAGFVYYPSSPRHIECADARLLAKQLPQTIQVVSVLVDPSDALLAQVQSQLQPDYVQLHGMETPQRITQIKTVYPHIKIIKAIRVRNGDDVASAMHFTSLADMLLFDAKAPELPSNLPGGNGLSFDWELLKNREFPLPWMLSGGLNCENVVPAIHQTNAKMIDVSSGVESAPGVKDFGLIDIFVKAARSA